METTDFARGMREICLKLSFEKKSAHLASSLSVVDILAVLFQQFLEYNVESKKFIFDNHLLLSKGHSASALYAALYLKNIISDEDMYSYCDPGSFFEEHPNTHIPTVDFPTGSLGHGLPLSCGLALGNKILNLPGQIFVVMSDGECNEGTVWESAQFAHTKILNNLVAIIDHNKFQATGPIAESLGNISLSEVFESFGWHVQEIDGHNLDEIKNALDCAKSSPLPSAIVANTIKGRGVDFMENDNNWHYRSPNETELKNALRLLDSSL